MELTSLAQEISIGEKQAPENGNDCSDLSAGYSSGCSHHHSLSDNSTGIWHRHIALAARLILDMLLLSGIWVPGAKIFKVWQLLSDAGKRAVLIDFAWFGKSA